MALGNSMNYDPTIHTVQVGDGLGGLVSIANGTTGQLLTAVTGADPAWSSTSGGITLTGDSGATSLSNAITLKANNSLDTCGATVNFINSGTTSLLKVTHPTLLNTFIGLNCGNATVSGNVNNGYGVGALFQLTSGVQNCAFGIDSLRVAAGGNSNTAYGYSTLKACTGSDNTAVGHNALLAYVGNNSTAVGSESLNNTTGTGNTAVGYLAGRSIVAGTNNTLLGFTALVNGASSSNCTGVGYQALVACTGNSNIALGYQAGSSITTGTGNLVLDNVGVATETNTTRIGTSQTSCFIKGIASVSVSNQQSVVINSSTGQLGALTGVPQLSVISADIDLKTVGNTLVFTPSADFVVVSITPYAKTLAGTIGTPIVNIGNNGATYDNIISGITLSTTQGNVYPYFNNADTPVMVASSGIYVRVATADATATTNTQNFAISGYYI